MEIVFWRSTLVIEFFLFQVTLVGTQGFLNQEKGGQIPYIVVIGKVSPFLLLVFYVWVCCLPEAASAGRAGLCPDVL
jgi:hypothetical protein